MLFKVCSRILKCLVASGVLLAHIVAPIYAAKGKGEEAASLAGGAMIGLGAAIAVPGGAAIAVGLLAPFVIKKIFDIVPKPEEITVKPGQAFPSLTN